MYLKMLIKKIIVSEDSEPKTRMIYKRIINKLQLYYLISMTKYILRLNNCTKRSFYQLPTRKAKLLICRIKKYSLQHSNFLVDYSLFIPFI